MKRVGEPEETLAEVLDRGKTADGFGRSEGIYQYIVRTLRVALPPIVFTRELRSQPENRAWSCLEVVSTRSVTATRACECA